MTPDVEFERVAQGFLTDYFEFYPTTGAGLGLHAYDGRAGDYSRPALDAWLRTMDGWERRLLELPPGSLTGQAAHDAVLIAQAIAQERLRFQVLRDHQRNPVLWSFPLDVTTYLKRNYAPLPERLRSLTSHLEEIPRFLEEAREHLSEPLALPIVETALEIYGGYRSFYASDLARAAAGGAGTPLHDRFEMARTAAAAALGSFEAFLAGAKHRATGEFAIGEAGFAAMLRSGEMVDLPLDRLVALGEAELDRLTEEVREVAGRVAPGAHPREVMAMMSREHPTEEALIPETRAMLEDLRRFLIEEEIVTVPGDVRPLVEETPPFARWAFAMMDSAGPFEEAATESYYYVTPPEPGWPREQREEWLTKFDYATLKDVSIHEAYPGHFVHFLHVRRAPSMAAKVLTSYSFVEGWAHYCEEMMLDAGVDRSPKFHLAQLAEALVRQVRYLAAIRMHAGEMTVDQATGLFVDRAYMEPLTAGREAVRGTFDPGYLNYTLGKFLVRKLRDDYRTERGAAFSLREFHDRLIGLGAPPVPLARRALLARDSGTIL